MIFSKKNQFYDLKKNWFMATFLENLPTVCRVFVTRDKFPRRMTVSRA